MDRARTIDRGLERALIANFAIHGLALIGMAALLMPMLPGGSGLDDASRLATLAAHPWRFRIGWIPWQLCAACDLWLAIAMVRARWLPRAPAWAVLALTIAAVVPDQYAQAVWVVRGPALAASDPTTYLALEGGLFPLTAGWGALGYTLAALAWTWAFARAGTWSRALTWLSVPLWITMAIAATAPLVPASVRLPPQGVAVANALGFLQLQVWLALVAEQVLRRARPDAPTGRLARWRFPRTRGRLARVVGPALDALANSRLAHAILEPIPELAMRSDIVDVVYASYLIPAGRAAALVPEGLALQRLGPDGAYALFTFLTYTHGHFGPRALGPLRRLCPSPVQTNWRIHVEDPARGTRGIAFVTNAIGSTPLALAARLLAEGMPMHVLGAARVARSGARVEVVLEPGGGSAPDARATLTLADAPPAWTGAWAACFADFHAFLAYCVPQDRALATQPHHGRISRQEIALGIPLDACVPLVGDVDSAAARALIGDAASPPVCFYVPRVRFAFAAEAHDPL